MTAGRLPHCTSNITLQCNRPLHSSYICTGSLLCSLICVQCAANVSFTVQFLPSYLFHMQCTAVQCNSANCTGELLLLELNYSQQQLQWKRCTIAHPCKQATAFMAGVLHCNMILCCCVQHFSELQHAVWQSSI